MPQFFVRGIDSTIDEYIDKNTDKIRNILLSNEIKKEKMQS